MMLRRHDVIFLLMEPAPFCFPNKIYLDCLHTSERKYSKETVGSFNAKKKYFFGGETALAAARIFAGGADGAKYKQMLLRREPNVER
jgi:hypothetical protein